MAKQIVSVLTTGIDCSIRYSLTLDEPKTAKKKFTKPRLPWQTQDFVLFSLFLTIGFFGI